MKNKPIIKNIDQGRCSNAFRRRYFNILKKMNCYLDKLEDLENELTFPPLSHQLYRAYNRTYRSIHATVLEQVRIVEQRSDNKDLPSLNLDVATVLGTNSFSESVRCLIHGIQAGKAIFYPLETTTVPIHPNRHGEIVEIAGEKFVVMRWKTSTLLKRMQLAQKFQAFLIENLGNSEFFSINVCLDLAYIVAGDETVVIQPFLGMTIEDLMKQEAIGDIERSAIVASLKRLRELMVNSGSSWQGFAPRNMFYAGGQIHLIDFEEIYGQSNEWDFYSSLRWHQIWFRECLTSIEFSNLFSVDKSVFSVSLEHLKGRGDSFEREWFQKETITWKEKSNLMDFTLVVEGKHSFSLPSGDLQSVYGHELGHFWGDFMDTQSEVKIYRFLQLAHEEEIPLYKILKIFEMAAEADIEHLMVDTVLRTDGTIRNPYTKKLIDLLENLQPKIFADASDFLLSEIYNNEKPLLALIDRFIYHAERRRIGVDDRLISENFFGEEDLVNQHADWINKAVEIGLEFHKGQYRDEKFHRFSNMEMLAKSAAESVPENELPMGSLIAEFEDRIAKYSINQADKTFLAFPDSGNSSSAMIGTILGQFLNQNLVSVERGAPIASFIEFQVIEWLRELIGYNAARVDALKGIKDAAGLWTTGGYMSNFVGILTALRNTFPEVSSLGIRGLNVDPAVLVCGQVSHYSVEDAADRLGIGRSNVLKTKANQFLKSDPLAIEKMLANPPTGKKIFVVVGIAGNTRTTGIDDLEEIGRICRKYGVWYHVDACHGGNLLFSKTLKDKYLKGIESADSVTIDPHKGLFATYPSSYVLFKDRGKLIGYSRHVDMVKRDDVWDWGLVTPFLCSRGFESLKTWFTIKKLGITNIGKIVEHRNKLMKYIESQLNAMTDFITLNDVDLYRLTFVFCPIELRLAFEKLEPKEKQEMVGIVKDITHRLCAQLYESNTVCIDEHTLEDVGNRVGLGKDQKYNVMAISVGNPMMTIQDVDKSIEQLRKVAEVMKKEIAMKSTSTKIKDYIIGGPAGWNL